MTQHVYVMVLIAAALFYTVIWGGCLLMLYKIRRQLKANDRLKKTFIACETSIRLHSDFRVIRHDFANYIQAAGALYDEDSQILIKKQKKAVRSLITDWNNQADVFLREHEGT